MCWNMRPAEAVRLIAGAAEALLLIVQDQKAWRRTAKVNFVFAGVGAVLSWHCSVGVGQLECTGLRVHKGQSARRVTCVWAVLNGLRP